LNYVGTARPIHDAKGKATGYTKYAGDLSLPNMAYLCMLHSKIPHGYVKAVHAEKALALPGVYGVYHCLNTTDRKYNRYRSNFDQAYLPNEECAFNDYVRFVGDKIGVVAACDQETAERAARLVEVEYEELPFSIGFDDTLAGKNCLEGETNTRWMSAKSRRAPKGSLRCAARWSCRACITPRWRRTPALLTTIRISTC
jgi:CO/xanthine dehydrogenase Mo-binding subunit